MQISLARRKRYCSDVGDDGPSVFVASFLVAVFGNLDNCGWVRGCGGGGSNHVPLHL